MICRATLAAIIGLSAGSAQAAEFARLEPYQMVRSLQLVQDQLAGGDHAALPMQKKLLEFADDLFRTSSGGAFDDRRNLTALFIYAMSGGNPATVEAAISRIGLEGDELAIGQALVAYTHGEMQRAGQLLAPVDSMGQESEVGALLALVKGSIAGPGNAAFGMEALDRARLLAPGTLVEEAALRRSLPLCVALDDADRFLQAANQYTRRFLRSPYASEFADVFVAGLVALNVQISTTDIEEIVSYMPKPQQQAIYLRLARQSTIHGHSERAAFAAGRAGEFAEPLAARPDARAELYAAMAAVTSKNIDQALAAFDRIDPTSLSPRDRRLLAGAETIAAEILAPPIVWADETPSPAALSAEEGVGAGAMATASAVGTGTGEAAAQAVASRALSALQDSAGEVPQITASVRERLQAIDRLLEENDR